jgi:hypothetical protein
MPIDVASAQDQVPHGLLPDYLGVSAMPALIGHLASFVSPRHSSPGMLAIPRPSSSTHCIHLPFLRHSQRLTEQGIPP